MDNETSKLVPRPDLPVTRAIIDKMGGWEKAMEAPWEDASPREIARFERRVREREAREGARKNELPSG